LAVVAATAVCADDSIESGSMAERLPAPDPVNLQVLSTNLSGERVRKLMKSYSRDLGVSCSHCHLEDPESQTVDYVADDKPAKQAARLMITMLDDINDKYLSRLGRDPRYSEPMTCGSCHQGQSTPPVFEGAGS
jgi:hypothetical protein